MKIVTTIIILIFSLSSILGQVIDNAHNQLRINARPYGDSIKLIWNPGNAKLWENALKKGFVLKRKTLAEEEKFSRDASDLSEVNLGVFKCLDSLSWMQVLDTSDHWEILSAGMVYGEFESYALDDDLDLSYYQDKQDEIQNKYVFNILANTHSFNAAVRMGMAYTDSAVVPGASYQYEISLNDPVLESVYDVVVITQNEFTPLPKLINPIIENEPSGIVVKWDGRYFLNDYISYSIERRVEGIDDYILLNESPIIASNLQDTVSFLDDNVQDSINYTYRIKGRSPFGEWGPLSPESSITRITYSSPAKPFIHKIEETTKGCYLYWNNPNSTLNSILGYNLYFSTDYTGPFKKVNDALIQASDSSYQITQIFSSGYFYIEVIGIDGQREKSVKRLYNPEDTVPPQTPNRLQCNLDSMGNSITISWLPNIEADLLGYRLYYGSNKSGQYLDIGEGIIKDTFHVIQINRQGNGEQLNFQIVAIDNRYNMSDPSETCLVIMPDRIQPIAPLIRKIINGDSIMSLEWATSPSWDVNFHMIERRKTPSGNWEVIQNSYSYSEIQTYIDSTAEHGIVYQYRVSAVDKSGNSNASEIKSGRLNINQLKPKIELQEPEIENGYVKIKWNYSDPYQIDRFIIYRSVNEEGLVTYKILNGENLNSGFREGQYALSDRNIKQGNRYSYLVRAVWKDGISSPMSKKVEIKVPVE